MKAVIIRLGLNNITLSPNHYHQEYVLSLDNKKNLVCELIIGKTDQKESNQTDQKESNQTDQKESNQTDQSKETYTLKIGLLTINVTNKLHSSINLDNDEIYLNLNKVL